MKKISHLLLLLLSIITLSHTTFTNSLTPADTTPIHVTDTALSTSSTITTDPAQTIDSAQTIDIAHTPSSTLATQAPEPDAALSSSSFDTLPASKTGVTVVFDLNGVLLTTDKWHAFKDIGLKLISRYAWQHGMATAEIEHKLPATLYDLLDKVQPEGNDCNAHDHWGNRMPGIMCDWQRGKKSNAEIKQAIDTYFKQNPTWHKGFKSSKQSLLLNVMEKMFTPARLAASMKTIPDGIAFAKKCKQEGHTLVVLSNWDPESFPLIKQRFPELFELFDAVFVSGELHAMKPEPKVYDKLLARKAVHGEQIIFIDDQPENIIAAKKQGISTILCPLKASYKYLCAEFKRLLETSPCLGFPSAPVAVPDLFPPGQALSEYKDDALTTY